MRAYLTALLYSTVAGGISAAVAGKPYRKHLRFLAALICTALIVSPIVGLVPRLELEPPREADVDCPSYDLAAEQAAEDAAVALQNYIFNETGVKTEDIHIDMERVEGQLYLRSVRLKAPKADCDRVKQCLDTLFDDTVSTEVVW